MSESIKIITVDDLEETLVEWRSIHVDKKPNFFLVNPIDVIDLPRDMRRKNIEPYQFSIGRPILQYNSIQIIRSDDIPHGEIIVV